MHDFDDAGSFAGCDQVCQSGSVRRDNRAGGMHGRHLIRERHFLEPENVEADGGKGRFQFGFVRESPLGGTPAGNIDSSLRRFGFRQSRQDGIAKSCQIARSDETRPCQFWNEYAVRRTKRAIGEQDAGRFDAEKRQDAVDVSRMIAGKQNPRIGTEIEGMKKLGDVVKQRVIVNQIRSKRNQRSRAVVRVRPSQSFYRTSKLVENRQIRDAFLEYTAFRRPNGSVLRGDENVIQQPNRLRSVNGSLAEEIRGVFRIMVMDNFRFCNSAATCNMPPYVMKDQIILNVQAHATAEHSFSESFTKTDQ